MIADTAHLVYRLGFIMAALWNRAGHFIFAVVSSSFYLSIFFSFLPNLSRCKLDVYYTSTHGVALVRIYDAGVKRAAHGSLKIQNSKNRHLGTITHLCLAMSSQLRHVSTIGKKLVKQQYLLRMS